MKKIVRTGCFETNSSSCHSISISQDYARMISPEDELIQSFIQDNKFIIPEPSGEFGWEQEEYEDLASKLDYLIIYIRDWNKGDELRLLDILKEVIKDYTKKEVELEGWGSLDSYGYPKSYIDHQSVEDKDFNYLFEDKEKLKNFLFNYRSILKTDNDNY